MKKTKGRGDAVAEKKKMANRKLMIDGDGGKTRRGVMMISCMVKK